jgi:hypothetical protein
VKRERRLKKEERRAERKHNAATGTEPEPKADEESQ